jgi:hypothetical protein
MLIRNMMHMNRRKIIDNFKIINKELHALKWFSLRRVNWRFRKNRWVTHFFWLDLAHTYQS